MRCCCCCCCWFAEQKIRLKHVSKGRDSQMQVQQRPRHCRKGKGGKKKAPASVAAFLRGGIKERVDLHSLNASMITEQRKKQQGSGHRLQGLCLHSYTAAGPPLSRCRSRRRRRPPRAQNACGGGVYYPPHSPNWNRNAVSTLDSRLCSPNDTHVCRCSPNDTQAQHPLVNWHETCIPRTHARAAMLPHAHTSIAAIRVKL